MSEGEPRLGTVGQAHSHQRPTAPTPPTRTTTLPAMGRSSGRAWPFAVGVGQVASGHHVDDPQYAESSRALGEGNLFHRKHWEWVFIHATAERLGLLKTGRSALGFGVGREPLVSAFGAAGLHVTATDQPSTTAGAWADTGQHAQRARELLRPNICDEAVFDANVSFRPVDMTDPPDDLGTHDLVWSSCCFEHLGSPEAGFAFVERSMRFVKPGGVALHTTEFDLARVKPLKQQGSIAAGDYVCYYRRREIADLAARLRRHGFEVELDLRVSNDHPMERRIDREPYSHDPHLRVAMAGRIITSVGLCIRRPHHP